MEKYEKYMLVKYKKTYVSTASDLIDFSILVNKVVISREVSMS